MDNEEIFDRMVKFIENHEDDGIIKNVDGRIGTLVMGNGEVYILCDNERIDYDMDTLVSTIMDDGWLFE